MSGFGVRILKREIEQLVKEYERIACISTVKRQNADINNASELIKTRIKELNQDIDRMSIEKELLSRVKTNFVPTKRNFLTKKT